jgi:erythromycin esterase
MRYTHLQILALALAGVACSQKKAIPLVVAPVVLEPNGALALEWVDQHATPITVSDSGRVTVDSAALHAFVADARIIGISELTEGTREFPALMKALIWNLAERDTLRALAIQAPAAEVMELDRYVKGATGSPKNLLRALGSVHWDTREMVDFVDWLRDFNRTRAVPRMIGFYGFEIPNIAHAAQVVSSLSDSATGPGLKQWLTQQYGCVVEGERANWGREGYAADSSYWKRCGAIAAVVADSLRALNQRALGTRFASEVGFAEQMAHLIAHSADVGLRRLPRHEVVAEHVLWLANTFAANGRLLVWGRDVEAGRLQLPGPTIQMSVPLTAKIGTKYRNLAFAFGEGTVRANRLAPNRQSTSESTVPVAPPIADSYENVLNRSRVPSYLLDLRQLPTGEAGTWLKGPHSMRLISGAYAPDVPESFATPIKFPEYYDGVIFLKRVTAANKS